MKCNSLTAYMKQIKLLFQKRNHCIIPDSDLHHTPKTNEALQCVQRVTDRKWSIGLQVGQRSKISTMYVIQCC
jgi:hypothetical protein